jgi:hypothetical protein
MDLHKTYNCNLCSKKYKHRQSLNKHMNTKHTQNNLKNSSNNLKITQKSSK